MAQVSIKEALKFSFFTYARHIVLFLMVGALVGVSAWAGKMAPRLLAQKLGCMPLIVESEQIVIETPPAPSTAQSDMAVKSVQNVTSKLTTCLSNAPVHHVVALVLLALALWFWNMLLFLGVVKLGLTLKDTGKESIATLFEARHVFFRWLGGCILFALYAISMILGMALLTIPLMHVLRMFIPSQAALASLTGVVGFALILGMFFWAIRYVFFGYCLLDNRAHGVRDALSESRKVVKGHAVKLVAALFTFALAVIAVLIPLFMAGIFSKVITLTNVQDMQSIRSKVEILSAILSGVLLPLGSLYMASIYRGLTR